MGMGLLVTSHPMGGACVTFRTLQLLNLPCTQIARSLFSPCAYGGLALFRSWWAAQHGFRFGLDLGQLFFPPRRQLVDPFVEPATGASDRFLGLVRVAQLMMAHRQE